MTRPSNLSRSAHEKGAALRAVQSDDYVAAQKAMLEDVLARLDLTDSARDAAPLFRIAVGLINEVADVADALNSDEDGDE